MTGQFAFDNVPAGEHNLTASFIGYERKDTTIVVDPGRFEPVVIRLPYGNGLKQVCPSWPECVSLPPDSTLQLAAVRTLNLLADSASGVKAFQDIAKCIEFKDVPGENGVASRKTATGGQCAIRNGWVETVDREPAMVFLVEVQASHADSARALLSYYAGPLWAAIWKCRFEHTELGWRVCHCDYPMQS